MQQDSLRGGLERLDTRKDQVGKVHGRDDISLAHRTNRLLVLVLDGFGCAPTLRDVASEPAFETNVVGSGDVDLGPKELTNLSPVKRKEPLHNDEVRCGHLFDGSVAGVLGEVIDGLSNRTAR